MYNIRCFSESRLGKKKGERGNTDVTPDKEGGEEEKEEEPYLDLVVTTPIYVNSTDGKMCERKKLPPSQFELPTIKVKNEKKESARGTFQAIW